MSDEIDKLNELALVLKDGQVFYEESKSQVKNPNLKQLFEIMSEIRRQYLIDTNMLITHLGGKPSDKEGTLIGSFRKGYADIKAKLSTDTEYTYIDQLEELEDRTLDTIRELLANTKEVKTKDLLQRALIKFQNTHDQMKALQKAS